MSIIISVINYKGGVGKTTLTLNLGYGLSILKNKKVLLIDLDPQCSLSIGSIDEMEWIDHIENKGSIISLIEQFYKGKLNIDWNWIYKLKQADNMYILPGHLNLPEYEMKLVATKPLFMPLQEFESKRYLILKHALDSVKEFFDYILLDCPPNIYMLSRNAILSSNYYIIPTIPDYVSSFGIPFIYKHIEEFVQNWYGKTRLLGIILNKVKMQKNNFVKEHKLEYDKLKERFGNLLFTSSIMDRILISAIMRKKINIFKENSKKYESIQKEFEKLIYELEEKISFFS